MSYTQKQGDNIRQFYANDRGIGFFYPNANAEISGISRIYGLAYTDEGWHELERGVGRVEVTVGGNSYDANLYVKDRYFVVVFDTLDYPDGELKLTATAWDKEGELIGSVSETVRVRNKYKPHGRRLYAAPDGCPEGDGSLQSPYDIATALDVMSGGDVLFLRGGEYKYPLAVKKSGSAETPTVIMAYPGERVEIVGERVTVEDRVEYAILSGINQHGTAYLSDGIFVGQWLSHVSIWDSSFTDNTSPYENGTFPMGYGMGAGVRINSVDASRGDHSQMRRYIEFSHVLSSRNDVDAFVCSGIQYGRYQFCEGSWCPDARNPVKRLNYHQFRHANGFNSTNTAYRWSGLASGETTFLFCLSHHNGQDGWDYQSPNPRLFGCVTYGEAAVGVPYGGVGLKFWEYNNTIVNSVTYLNNINDDSGSGMRFAVPKEGECDFPEKYSRIDTLVANCAFYHCHNTCIGLGSDTCDHFRVEGCVFEHSDEIITEDISKNEHCFFSGNLMWDIEHPENTLGAKEAEPGFLDPENGCFFPKEGAAMLKEGNVLAYSFDVDGVDCALYDGLGRPRNSTSEAGPYTRYDHDTVEYV